MPPTNARPEAEATHPAARRDEGRFWLNRVLAAAEPLSIAALFVFLLVKTWLRWPDPLVDFPRDLYIAWRQNEGGLLYRDLQSWYGPLSNLMEGMGFKIFGTGLDTIVWMNITLTVVVLLLLRSIFGAIGNRFSRWLVSVVFLSVFAFGDYVVISNYNFITPYVSQATYSFLGLLLAVWGLLHHLKSEKAVWLGAAGFGCAVAYLDKPEAMLAAAGAVAIYLAAQSVRQAHSIGTTHWLLRALAWLAGGFLSLWLPVFIYFWVHTDMRFAWHAANAVPDSVLGGPISNAALNSHLLQVAAGFDNPWRSLMAEVKATGLALLLSAPLVIGSRQWGKATKHSASWWAWLLVAMAPIVAVLFWLPPLGLWERSPSACVIPACIAAVGCTGWSIREAIKGGANFSRALGLAVVGVAASLMLARIILNARVSHYGFVLAPLAVFFCIHLVMVEAAQPAAASQRPNWLLPAVFAPVVLLGCGVLLSDSLTFYRMKTLEVGSGRDRFYALPLSIQPNGWELKTMIEAYDEMKPRPETLVVFPEGIAVNYHLRVASPLAELEHTPLALSYTGPQHVLAELKARPPAAVFLHARDLTEYGAPYFGADEASGSDIARWLQDNYNAAGFAGTSPNSITGHALDFLVRKAVKPE